MELRHFRYFIALAEELHFGRAARRLNVVQPALSQQIRQLEQELGVMLLSRTKRRVMLTESGRAFLVEARRTLASAEQSALAARSAAAGEVGRLRVGYVDLATWSVLPKVLRTYRKRYPRVELVLTELHREPQREALLRGDLDVGFFSLREPRGALTGARVIDDQLVVALPRDHKVARRARIPLAAARHRALGVVPTRDENVVRGARACRVRLGGLRSASRPGGEPDAYAARARERGIRRHDVAERGGYRTVARHCVPSAIGSRPTSAARCNLAGERPVASG